MSASAKKCVIAGDRWQALVDHEWRVDSASAADFDRVLDRLDAHVYTLITIHAEGGKHLAIGGGDGRYVVYATFDDEVFWNLLSTNPGTGTVLLSAGGQEGDFPAERIVSKEQARAAGHAFLAAGRLDARQRWRQA